LDIDLGLVFLGLQSLGVAFLVTFAVTPAVIALGGRWGAVDHPGPRKIHAVAVPRIGGLAVAAGFAAGMAWVEFRALTPLFGFPRPTAYWGLVAGGALVFLMGLLDDLRGLSFKKKFAVQIVAAAIAWQSGFRIEGLFHAQGATLLDFGWLSLPITVLWIVGVTNALNLIDGLDGLAAGSALITAVAVASMALISGQKGIVAASLALVGSLGGFLRYNFNPARIFLGDSGSMLLGFVLAVISIRSSQKGPTLFAALAPALVLGLPLLDTALAIIRRTRRLIGTGRETEGRLRWVLSNFHRVFLPDRAHLHHVLLDLGLSQRRAAAVLYACVAVLAGAGLLMTSLRNPFVAGVLLGVTLLAVAVFVAVVVLLRHRTGRTAAGGGHGLRPEGVTPASSTPVGR
jgi:UDP-GlcNAc:undecaprenyl-phosphate GlcNAc-1-phosphate transferase